MSALNYAGTPNRLLSLLAQGEFQLYISPFISTELQSVLTEKILWEVDRTRQALRLVREMATEVDPPYGVSVIKEKDDDNRILECAIHVNAHYLISGDRHHLLPIREFQGVAIVTPAEFLDLGLSRQA